MNSVAGAQFPSLPLAGLRAVVTGAAGGIGSSIARQLMRQGAIVHGLDQDSDGLKRLTEEADSGSFAAYPVDLADRVELDRVLGDVLDGLQQRCDILVNNVGVSRLRSLTNTDDGLLDWMLAVNFVAPFRITRTLLPALRASACGAIVNIASELALVGQPEYSAYCATKGAVLAWSRALALELAEQHIRVNVVCPGPIDTKLLQEEFATHHDPRGAQAAEIVNIPLGRLGLPADIAPVVAFLASSAAAFVTGAAWCVDGGKTAR
jgi:NAD(P)-dependent dehydrogenase (short-subunit alcohol dehydrogenase family)